MSLFHFFKLIRWKNLLIVVYIFINFEFVFFPAHAISHKLNSSQFLLLLTSVLLIMSAGYVINDIFDIKTDKVNRKSNLISKFISIGEAKRLYLILNTIGISFGIILCLNTNNLNFAFIFFGTPLLLYFYSKKWKSKPLIGNIIISILVSFSSIILVLFDADFSKVSEEIKLIIILFSIFAFIINLTREICKDIEDIKGDYALKMNTLPILIGRNRAKRIAVALTTILAVSIASLAISLTTVHKLASLYLVLIVLTSIIFTFYKLKKATSKKHFKIVNTYLKINMFLGINTILILSTHSNVL